MRDLAFDLGEFMASIDSQFVIEPRKIISRIHRDVRFSKDKSLYRDRIWITYKRKNPEWQSFPAYFFELSPRGTSHGMGFYQANKESMGRFRAIIDETPEKFTLATAFFTKGRFALEGEEYKRKLGDFPENIAPWYNKKSFYLIRREAVNEDMFSAKLVGKLINDFDLLADLYRLLTLCA